MVNKVTPTRYVGHPQEIQASQWEEIFTKRPNPRVYSISYVEESEEQSLGLFTVKDKANSSILVDLSNDGTPITMTLDTGASVSIISEKTYSYHSQLSHLQLDRSELLLHEDIHRKGYRDMRSDPYI